MFRSLHLALIGCYSESRCLPISNDEPHPTIHALTYVALQPATKTILLLAKTLSRYAPTRANIDGAAQQRLRNIRVPSTTTTKYGSRAPTFAASIRQLVALLDDGTRLPTDIAATRHLLSSIRSLLWLLCKRQHWHDLYAIARSTRPCLLPITSQHEHAFSPVINLFVLFIPSPARSRILHAQG